MIFIIFFLRLLFKVCLFIFLYLYARRLSSTEMSVWESRQENVVRGAELPTTKASLGTETLRYTIHFLSHESCSGTVLVHFTNSR